ncbi:MAG: hypothetical protein ACXWQO_03545 [Bdellovibrionota bacterium]
MQYLQTSLAIMLIFTMGSAQAARKPAAAVGGSSIYCDFTASMADKPGDEPGKRFGLSSYGENLEFKGLALNVKRASGMISVAIKYPDGTRAAFDASGTHLHLMQFVAIGGEGNPQINYELECK